MNTRRDFIKTSLVVAAGMAVSNPTKVFAASGKLPAGLIYTKENPGMWAKKVGSHLPKVSVKGNKVTITTEHPMRTKHFIVRHTLITTDGEVLGSKTFTPDDEAISTYELPTMHSPTLYATSFCNQHDFWVAEFNV